MHQVLLRRKFCLGYSAGFPSGSLQARLMRAALTLFTVSLPLPPDGEPGGEFISLRQAPPPGNWGRSGLGCSLWRGVSRALQDV